MNEELTEFMESTMQLFKGNDQQLEEVTRSLQLALDSVDLLANSVDRLIDRIETLERESSAQTSLLMSRNLQERYRTQ